MLERVSTLLHTLSRPVGYLVGRFRTHAPGAAQPSDSTPKQRRASSHRPASGCANDDTAPEPQAVAEWNTVPKTVPEWETDLWKHRVEGEARRRLNREIAGVGRHRS